MERTLIRLYATFWALALFAYLLACVGARFRVFWLAYVALGIGFGLLLFGKHIWRVRRVYKEELIRERTRQQERARMAAEMTRFHHPA